MSRTVTHVVVWQPQDMPVSFHDNPEEAARHAQEENREFGTGHVVLTWEEWRRPAKVTP